MTHVLDLDLADVAVLQRAEALVVGAAEDEVARLEGHHGGESSDDVTAAVLHVAGAIVLPELAIHGVLDAEVVRVPDLVGGRDRGAEGEERVEGLAVLAGQGWLALAPGAGGDIPRGGGAED